MPHFGNAAGGSSLAYQLEDNRQSSAFPVITSENVEEESIAAVVTGGSIVIAVAAEAEGPG